MSVTERSSGRLYQFSAYESNETKRRMRSLHSKAWSNEETMEPQIPPENKTWRDKFAAFQQSVTCRFAAPRVTTTVAHPFFSLVLMSGSILTGLFPLSLIGRAVRRSIRRIHSSFSVRSSRTFREYGIQTEGDAIGGATAKQECHRDERAFCQCQSNY